MGNYFEEIGDAYFGGAEKDAAKEEQKGLANASQALQNSSAIARGESTELFRRGAENAQGGFQAALDTWNRTIPQQMQTYQDGNVQGQQQMLGGLQQGIGAMLGQPVDFRPIADSWRVSAPQYQNATLPTQRTIEHGMAADGQQSFTDLNMPSEAHYIRGRLAAGEISYEEALDLITSGRDYGQFDGISGSDARTFLKAYSGGQS